jgi:hypothetical protein
LVGLVPHMVHGFPPQLVIVVDHSPDNGI